MEQKDEKRDYRMKYMAFHESIKSTDPAYLLLCEDVKEIKRLREALEQIVDPWPDYYAPSNIVKEMVSIAREALESEATA